MAAGIDRRRCRRRGRARRAGHHRPRRGVAARGPRCGVRGRVDDVLGALDRQASRFRDGFGAELAARAPAAGCSCSATVSRRPRRRAGRGPVDRRPGGSDGRRRTHLAGLRPRLRGHRSGARRAARRAGPGAGLAAGAARRAAAAAACWRPAGPGRHGQGAGLRPGRAGRHVRDRAGRRRPGQPGRRHRRRRDAAPRRLAGHRGRGAGSGRLARARSWSGWPAGRSQPRRSRAGGGGAAARCCTTSWTREPVGPRTGPGGR